MLTAETVTDEQIRELHESANNSHDWDLVMDCVTACPGIGRPGRPAPATTTKWEPVLAALHGIYPSDILRRRNARARCAEILNAREASRADRDLCPEIVCDEDCPLRHC